MQKQTKILSKFAILAVTLLLFLVVFSFADDGKSEDRITGVFKYDDEVMDVGSVYHYIATNDKGEKPMDTWLYIQSKDTIDVYKDFFDIIPGEIYVINWQFSWKYFMAKKPYAYNICAELSEEFRNLPNIDIKTISNIDFEKGIWIIESYHTDKNGKIKKQVFTTKYETPPLYDYSFFFFDLQMAMRHLVKDVKEFKVSSTYMGKLVDTTLKYSGVEKVNNIECNKWSFQGEGVLAKTFGYKGFIWLSKEKPYYCVKLYCGLQRVAWKPFILELKDIKTTTQKDWDNFKVDYAKKRMSGEK